MSKVYITGHRNPDLDSICSAMGYAALKKVTDPDKDYEAVRCGHLSDNIKSILASLQIEPPVYMRDVLPKVKDVMMTEAQGFDVSQPLTVVAEHFDESYPSAFPVFDGGKFAGLLSLDDITVWGMRALSNHKQGLKKIPTIGELLRKQEEPLKSTELFDEAKNRLMGSGLRGLAVFENGEYVGYVTRRCFLKAPKYEVILVDHNEPRQSIKGIENAAVVEIIDHHNIDSVKTELPVFIDAEPLGSSCTIVAQLFHRHRVTMDPQVAKILLTGLISDTLILKSPTTTSLDEACAKELAGICGVDLQEFGLAMFSHVEGLEKRDPENAIASDFKSYTEKGVQVGIGQVEVTTLKNLRTYSGQFLTALEAFREKNGLNWAVLMITDIIHEHSVLLSTNYRATEHLPYSKLSAGLYDMPGVMSRKKQLLPEIIYTLDMF